VTATDRPSPSEAQDWEAMLARPEFQELRRRLRRFMSIKLWGNINVGLVFGLLQFVSTFAITAAYVRFADRKLDPLSAEMRGEIESGEFERGGK
jgi:uncharacterized membrane protein (DUF485 family)